MFFQDPLLSIRHPHNLFLHKIFFCAFFLFLPLVKCIVHSYLGSPQPSVPFDSHSSFKHRYLSWYAIGHSTWDKGSHHIIYLLVGPMQGASPKYPRVGVSCSTGGSRSDCIPSTCHSPVSVDSTLIIQYALPGYKEGGRRIFWGDSKEEKPGLHRKEIRLNYSTPDIASIVQYNSLYQ